MIDRDHKPEIFFTIDVEEWWSVNSLRNYIDPNGYSRDEDRIEEGLNPILSLLEQHHAKGTFFFLGRVAERHPDCVRAVLDAGHELGTHGYAHKRIFEQSPKDFEQDLVKSLRILEGISGQKITQYRAPSYSINSKSLWSLEVLAKNGIRLDSSIIPAELGSLGPISYPKAPYRITFPDSNFELIELPPNIVSFCGRGIPITSGFAFRFFPSMIIEKVINANIRLGIANTFILHSWEFDQFHPRIKCSRKSNLIHYYGLNNLKQKVESYLSRFRFVDCASIETPNKILTINQLIGGG